MKLIKLEVNFENNTLVGIYATRTDLLEALSCLSAQIVESSVKSLDVRLLDMVVSNSGSTINAIKLYREETYSTLRVAKDYVDGLLLRDRLSRGIS